MTQSPMRTESEAYVAMQQDLVHLRVLAQAGARRQMAAKVRPRPSPCPRRGHRGSLTGPPDRWFETNGCFLTYYKSKKMEKLLAALNLPQVGEIKVEMISPFSRSS